MLTEHFYSLNTFLRQRHHDKVIKLSVDAGFSCPNRTETTPYGGCIFCSSRGSGDFAAPHTFSIDKQIEHQLNQLKLKWPKVTQYIVYFQAYTNTYASLDVLKHKFEAALAQPGVVGLAIATRPDCLPLDVLDYLSELSKRTHLWIELGLQTIHPTTAALINRGYDLDCFLNAVDALHARDIECVCHLIFGLPGETPKQMLETVQFISHLPLQGVKFHMLHILRDTPLEAYMARHPYALLCESTYIELVATALMYLPSSFVIHRLTGDPAAQQLIAPEWTRHKRQVLNRIQRYLRQNNIFQGMYFET